MTELHPSGLHRSRRRFLIGAGAVAAVSAVGIGTGLNFSGRSVPPVADESPGPPPSLRPGSSRRTFDELAAAYRELTPLSGIAGNDWGRISWSESYVMQAFLAMYRATRDEIYLQRFNDVATRILEVRDDVRGVRDYLGQSRPVWSADQKYTSRWADLRDEAGVPVFRVRSAALALATSAEVRAAGDGFDLTVRYGRGADDVVRGFTTDRSDPRYLLDLLRPDSRGDQDMTAVDLRAEQQRTVSRLAQTSEPMVGFRYGFAVHTGMISAPLADFAALVAQNGELRSTWGEMAAACGTAAQSALRAHEAEYRDWGNGLVYGFERGAPVRGDGTELPTNQFLAIARALTSLSAWDRDEAHAERAGKMIDLFVADLGRGTAPTWPYFWSRGHAFRGWDRASGLSEFSPALAPQTNLEDTGHGVLDVECAVACHRGGVGPDQTVLDRLAATFESRVIRRDAHGGLQIASSLNPRSGVSEDAQVVGRWTGVAPGDTEVVRLARTIIDREPLPTTEGVSLLAVASLIENGSG